MRALMLLLTLVVFATAAQAASLEENFAQAQAAFKAGDYARAGDLFAAAGDQLHKGGDASRAGMLWGNAAVAHIKAENWAVAGDLYEKILATNKRLPQDQALRVYKNLVLCRGKLNQRALQIMAIERMLKAIPKLPPAELADVYARQGDAYRAMELYGPAAAAYDKAAHILPATAPAAQRARMYTAMGLCQGNLGEYTKATKSLEEARKLAETVNEPLTIAESDSNLGILHLERGDYPKALELLKRALEVEEKNSLRRNEGVEHNNLGLVYKAMGSHAEAMRRVEQSLTIAREVKNVRDEAIATVNRALLNRIAGQLHEARTDYTKAIKLFEECGFQEGVAGALLGVGRMEALANKNYTLALENYQKALDIYTRLSLHRGRAETLLQLGEVYKYIAAPGRTTRDLVYDDEPTLPAVAPNEALAQSRKYFALALELAQQLQAKEMIWSAHQGLGYADLREGKLENALKHYEGAIAIVTGMYASLESVELFGEYMADREDLYSEAQEVCSALYGKTRDEKYLNQRMQYAETLRNEKQKASAALVQMRFEDKKKQEQYERACAAAREADKAAKAVPIAAPLPENATPEQKRENELKKKEVANLRAEAQRKEEARKKAAADFEKAYPEDKVLFSAEPSVTIKTIRENIRDTDAVLLYHAEPDALTIDVITKHGGGQERVQITKKKLDELITKEFVIGYLVDDRGYEEPLRSLFSCLVSPVEKYLKNIKRIYVVSSGFLAHVPFAALMPPPNEQNVKFLVDKYEIGYLRPMFIKAIKREDPVGGVKKILGVGNPLNINYLMRALPGSVDEISAAYRGIGATKLLRAIAVDSRISFDEMSKSMGGANVSINPSEKDFYFVDPDLERRKLSEDSLKELFPDAYPLPRPTEKWLRRELAGSGYEVLYFATHGVPFSEIYTNHNRFMNKYFSDDANRKKKPATIREKSGTIVCKNLKTKTPLNGFLYLSSDEGDDVMDPDRKIAEDNDGMLTIKEVLQLHSSVFSGTRYVILSACNTGVTFIPKAIKKFGMGDAGRIQEAVFDPKDTRAETEELGFSSEVNQISFVDSFMRRGVTNVFGTLWPADDKVSAIIMADFIKNLAKQGDHPDAIAAYTRAQRDYLKNHGSGDPFAWAVGAIFGK